ncbi:MAG: pentapeptide repeat-containing protein, partial [Candidatus Woesearchaeota archaeon]
IYIIPIDKSEFLTKVRITNEKELKDLLNIEPFNGSSWQGRLSEINIHGADFENSDLKSADFTDTYLKGVNFTNANLFGAELDQLYLHNLTGPIYNNTKIDLENYKIIERAFAEEDIYLDRKTQTLFDIIYA